MNKKNIFIIILIVLNFALITKQIFLTTNILPFHVYTSSNIEEKRGSNIIDTDKYKIDVYYPVSDYSVLNNAVMKMINDCLNQFRKFIKDNGFSLNQYYTLNIFYNKYEYSNYLSYVFRISEYTGGAHPNNTVSTISYNKDNNTIITIESLVKDNEKLLDLLSNESRSILKSNPLFKTDIIYDMMIAGTKPEMKNFKNLAFSKDGLIIFFEQYQIAPYSYGEFNVVIPYSKLKI